MLFYTTLHTPPNPTVLRNNFLLSLDCVIGAGVWVSIAVFWLPATSTMFFFQFLLHISSILTVIVKPHPCNNSQPRANKYLTTKYRKKSCRINDIKIWNKSVQTAEMFLLHVAQEYIWDSLFFANHFIIAAFSNNPFSCPDVNTSSILLKFRYNRLCITQSWPGLFL